MRIWACVALVATLGIAPLPPNIRVSITDRSLLFDSGGTVVSTAFVCPGYRFDDFGTGGPKFSPDQHWVMVDVLGPFAPGNVARTHALVNVRTGRLVYAPDFARILGVPSAPDGLAWVSGERAMLRYGDGSKRALLEPPKMPIPRQHCVPVAS